MAKLILLSGDERKEYELGPSSLLGRHPDSTIQILDRVVSKEHARIERRGDGQFVLRDLGSLNGTHVRGQRIASEHLLHDGDEILMGTTRLLFKQAEAPQGKVTIAADLTASHIRQRIAAVEDREFLAETGITDVGVLRRDYERLRMAHEMTRSIGAEIDLDRVLQKILDASFDLLRADRGVILLVDEGGLTQTRASRQRAGTSEIVLSTSVLNEVLHTKAAVLSSDASTDSRFSAAKSIIMHNIRSTMCVPLLYADDLLGIMHLDTQIASGAFGEKDLQILTGIARQAAVAIKNARLAQENLEASRTREQFKRLLSPNLVEQVVNGQLKVEQGGETREVTVLFTDIRGFTSMSEKKQPREVVEMLNEYFDVMVDVLTRYEATLDKYVGDEIMALFGAPIAIQDAPYKAIACGLEMQKALAELNRTRTAEGQEPITMGAGINTGEMVCGMLGSKQTMQYTVVGDAVNTGARLCSHAKAGEVLVSDSTFQYCRDRFVAEPLPPVTVKGKQQELRVWSVTGLR
jgi:adenylate cyclase